MERLTHLVNNVALSQGVVVDGDGKAFGPTIDRLAAYEDTGLTPETVTQLKQIAEIFHCDPSDTAQLNVLLTKLWDIAQAQAAGRLVVRPENEPPKEEAHELE